MLSTGASLGLRYTSPADLVGSITRSHVGSPYNPKPKRGNYGKFQKIHIISGKNQKTGFCQKTNRNTPRDASIEKIASAKASKFEKNQPFQTEVLISDSKISESDRVATESSRVATETNRFMVADKRAALANIMASDRLVGNQTRVAATSDKAIERLVAARVIFIRSQLDKANCSPSRAVRNFSARPLAQHIMFRL